MKALLLAAGYSKRLSELTQNTPKALLPIAGRPILDYLVDKLEEIKELEEVYLVTNNKYFSNFEEWHKNYKGRLNIEILNDMTNCNEERLGAIGDIILTIDHFGIDDDLLIAATDSYFDFDLVEFIEFSKQKGTDTVIGQRIKNKEELKRFGVAEIDENGVMIGMEEKPQEPKSDIVAYATYFYKKETLPLFKEYKKEGNNMDAPGNFLSWLYKRKTVCMYVTEKDFFDIGTVDVYNQVNAKADEIKNKKTN